MATISRLLKIIGLFCKRALSKRRYSAKETYNFKEPTNRSHPIVRRREQLGSKAKGTMFSCLCLENDCRGLRAGTKNNIVFLLPEYQFSLFSKEPPDFKESDSRAKGTLSCSFGLHIHQQFTWQV